jgi:hypothetical protein
MTSEEYSLVAGRLAMLPFALPIWACAILCVYLILKFNRRRAIGFCVLLAYAASVLLVLDLQLQVYRHLVGKRRVYDDNVAFAIVMMEMGVVILLMHYTRVKLQPKRWTGGFR